MNFMNRKYNHACKKYKYYNYAMLFFIIGLSLVIFIIAASKNGYAVLCCGTPNGCYDIPDKNSLPDSDTCTIQDMGVVIDSASSCTNYQNTQCQQSCCCQLTGAGSSYTAHSDFTNSYCTFISGQFRPDLANSCDVASCANQVRLVNISGYIKDNAGSLSIGSDVSIHNKNIFTSTNNVGYYYFKNIPAGVSQINANDSTCSGSLTVNANSNLHDQNFTLNNCCQLTCPDWSTIACTSGMQTRTCTTNGLCGSGVTQKIQSQSCTQGCTWVCSDWDQCSGGTEHRSCSPSQGCTASQAGAEPDLVQQCSISLPTCGNGVLDPGEDCEINMVNGVPNGELIFNTNSWCNGIKSACLKDSCECVPPPSGDQCILNHGDITRFNASNVRRIYGFNINWIFGPVACQSYIDHFELSVCDNKTGICSFNYVLNNNIPSSTRGYTQTTSSSFPIIDHTQYCYMLKTIFNDGTFDTNITCVTSGDDACMIDNADTWCGRSTIQSANPLNANLTCNTDNIVITPNSNNCPVDTYCSQSQTDSNSIECIPQGPCDKCNGVLGLFGYQGFGPIFDSAIASDTPLLNTCPSLDSRSSEPSGCYMDYSRTAVDKSFSCSAVLSCYNYFSKDTCENDYCNKFKINGINEVNGCEWAPYSSELNKGVCRPKNQAVQNCGACDIRNLNRLYPSCTKDTCGLYGSCFFNGKKCIDSANTTCSSYDNREDCIGTEASAVNVYTNVAWNYDSNNNPIKKISGDNSLINSSNDATNIGRCKWTVNSDGSGGTLSACIRDADNNNQGDCNVSNTKQKNYTLTCERDTSPPNIIINNKPRYNSLMNFANQLTYSDNVPQWVIGDDSSASRFRNTIWIYYCLTHKGDAPCYPDKIMPASKIVPIPSNLIYQYAEDITKPSIATDFTFYYFGEDPAKNLGSIKSFNFVLDDSKPQISVAKDFEYSNTTTEWRTNLTLTIKLLADTSLPVECTLTTHARDMTYTDFYNIWAKYYDIPSVLNVDNKLPSENSVLKTMYPYLPDDKYTYELSCVDDAGNTYYNTENITINGDSRIFDPQPDSLTFTTAQLQKLNVSINTSYQGACRYSMNTFDFNSMTAYSFEGAYANGMQIHTTPMFDAISINPASSISSGIYKIYSTCNLNINNKQTLVKGTPGDTIKFAVDNISPLTHLEQVDDNGIPSEYTYDQYNDVDHMDLKLVCDDNRPELNDGNKDMSFGCDNASSTYYCIRHYTDSSSCNDQTNKNPDDVYSYKLYDPSQGRDIVLDYTNGDSADRIKYGNDPVICYYSVDKGGNMADKYCTHLNLNTEIVNPIITIIDQ